MNGGFENISLEVQPSLDSHSQDVITRVETILYQYFEAKQNCLITATDIPSKLSMSTQYLS